MPRPGPFPFARHSDPPALHRSALLVVDLQRAFTDPEQPTFLSDAPAALSNTNQVLLAFRRAGRPIAFTRHAHLTPPAGPGMGHWWSTFILDQTPASQLDPVLAPTQNEPVFRKEHYSAFRTTPLEAWMHAQLVDTILVAGTMTHICVDTTARDAFMCGFNVIILHDACASKHRALHEASLQALSHAVARIENTASIVSRLEGAE